jgi:hypothetical protein
MYYLINFFKNSPIRQLVIYGIILFCSAVFLYSCASAGSLEGGPKDTDPPKLNKALSSPNYVTNSAARRFEFFFDEFVEVRDPIKEVLVSPPLVYIPKAISRGKKVVFELNEKEELKEKTTYVVNFGNSIVDLNESNPLKEFRLVFSTGDIIDSLIIEGSIKEAETGKAAQDITVLVYDDLSDSILLKQKPFYTAKTDESGKFRIENVKKDTFRIFAIKDENRSFTYNQGVELLGFLDTLVVFADTQMVYSCALEISKPLIDYRVFESNAKNYGIIRQKWSTPIYSKLDITPVDSSDQVYYNYEGDSVKIFYVTDKDSIFINTGFSTLAFKTPNKNTGTKNFLLSETSRSTFISGLDSMTITTTIPIASLDQKKIGLVDSFGNKINYDFKKIDAFKIRFFPIADGFKEAFLTLNKGAITDIFSNVNDSNTFRYTIVPVENLSELILNISDLDSSRFYTIFFKDKNEKILNTFTSENKKTFSISLARLKPEEYNLEIIDDTNKNGKWDPVNWWKKTQAEKVKTFKIDGLKENWSIDKEIKYTGS